ncbi:gamma-glutamylcyclotransferase family protein [Mucilaginibacter dorajii]|nr:gamma-glutamylcyclotransferase family protein [Mucilaginibacter dorajii]MCS3735845.1 gamma-glutamylcyclotransferase (GGCT)/AIG2-like uncharacterized protein YtfP [Mucilaginibacter dorajii]
MEITSSYLFVYGTLLINGNQYAVYLQKHCKLVGEGKIKGRLYDIGQYPGAIIDANAQQYIHGSIYLMDNVENVLEIIDEYEGLGSDEPQPYEYTRRVVYIETNNGIVACWVYLYNWDVHHFPEVSGGKYLDHINLNGKI